MDNDNQELDIYILEVKWGVWATSKENALDQFKSLLNSMPAKALVNHKDIKITPTEIWREVNK